MRDHIRLAVAAHRPRELSIEGHGSSAVLILLHEHEGIEHVVFQVRTQLVEHHRGQISLPGGAREPQDASLVATALRETCEEIGVDEADIEVFGALDDHVTGTSNYHIRPYVGALRLGADTTFAAAPLEVHELLRVPLAHLASPEAETVFLVDRDGRPAATQAFAFGEHVIWGATARIVAGFLEVMSALPAEGTRA